MRNFLLLVMMLVTTVANAANLLSKQYIGQVYYNIYDDGHAEATYGTLQSPENYKGEIQIRSSISVSGKSYTVTAIAEDAFYACSGMTAIYIPNTVKSIGATAFYSCTRLTEVTIPNSVTSIASKAFYKCSGLKSIDLTDVPLTTFGTYAFAECYRLQNIYLPKTLKTVPNYAFYCVPDNSSCINTSCEKITIPNSVTSIGSYAFANYRNLTTIEFGQSVKSIGSYAFYCYYTISGINIKCKKIAIPNSVVTIGDHSFSGYSELSILEIGNSVQSIGEYAFYGYSNYSNYINTSLKTVNLPNSLKTIGSYAFAYQKGLTSVEIPNSVTSIGSYAFYACSALKSVELSNSIKTIPSSCFQGCTSLLAVSLPKSVTSIESSAFHGCTSLGSISIPNSVTSIANYSSTSSSCPFYNCSQCIVYLCNDHISKSHAAFSPVKKVVSCDNVPMPVEINYAFFYTGKEQTYNIPSTSSYKVTGNKRTEEGTQQVTVHLYDGFTWTNGTSDDLVFDFTIYPAKLRPDQTVLTGYIGQKLKDLGLAKGYKWVDDENTVLEYAGVNTFPVEYSPEGWTKDPLLIEMTVNVTKTQIVPPAKDATEYTYDGKSHTYQIKETEFYKITNPDDLTQTNAGSYPIGIALKDKANHIWNTGYNTDLSYNFLINKQTVKRPEADPTEYVYTGKEITYKLAESPLYTVRNNEQTNVGSYTVYASLKDQANYMWDNGSSSDQAYSFVINKNGVKKPEADTRMFMFTGEPITYNIPENDLYTVTGNVQTNVGTYTVVVALKDKTYYRWSDGTTSDLKFTFKIEKLKVVIPPTAIVDFTYTGKPQTYPIASNDAFVTVIGYDSNTGRTGADSTQTNAGTYYVVLSLKDKTNSMWVKSLSDTYGNTGNQVYSFTIKQSDVTSYPAGMSPAELKLETTYGKTLKDITLPEGYAWVTPSTSVGAVGEKTFAADYTPKDSKNYLKTRVDLTVVVKPQPVSEPLADESLFFYNAKPQKYTLVSSDLYTVKNNVQTYVGEYGVVVSLRDKVNYEWKTSGSSDDLTYPFIIAKSSESIFETGYNPNEINPKVQYGQKLGDVTLPTRFSWKNPETVADKIGDNKYVVIYTPSDPDNYNSIETEIVVNVTKRKVAFPAKDSRMFVYNGEAQTYEVGSDDQFKVSNNVQTNAGRYDVIVALKDKEHYEWQDGTTDDIYQDFIIRTKSVEMPLVDSKSFVYDGKSHSLTIPASSDYTVSGNKGTDAGRYEVSISLADKKNYVWENNTSADIVATFSISKIKVEMPAADNSSFSYTGEPQTYKIEASDLYTVSGNVQTMAGSYSVKVALNNPRNYEWVDGSTDNLVYNFYIKGLVNQSTLDIVNIPSVAKRTFVYDENIHTLSLENTEKYTVVDEGGINVGRYSATLSLTDKSKYVWENGSSDDVTISYVITKAPVAIPAKDARTYTYNKRNQTYTILKDARYTISNNVQMNAGRYEVKVSLVDSKNYEWEDGSSDDITYIFKIGKATVAAPTADGTKFTFNGKPQTYTIVKNALYTVSNNVQTNVGTYDVIVSLADPKNYMWSDGTSNDLSYNFVIRAEQSNITNVSIPTVTTRSFVYNGLTQTLAIPESENYIITNNKRVNAGRYVATVTLRDPINTVWSDGTKEDIQYVFNITKAVVDIPEIDHTRFVYTGKEQTYQIPSSEFYTISGQSQTKVGQHEVVVSLIDVKNYMWSDGTVDDLSYSFVIRPVAAEKTEIAIPTVADNKFEYSGKVHTLDIKQSEYYNVFNNKGVEVGRYTVTLSLVDPETTVWSNGSTDDVLLTFVVTKAKVDFPAADYTQYTYNGDYQTYDIKSTSLYTVYNEEQIEAGRYEVGVALNDPKNYEWEDGTFADLSYSFLIGKAQIDEPKADQTKFIYDGKEKTYKIAASPLYTTYGTTQTLPGKYEVIVALNDSRNYEWSNGTIDDLIYNFVIRSAENSKKAIEIPTVLTNNFVYDGTAKSLAIAANTAYKVTGNSGVAAGRYTVTLSLTDPKATVWSDGSTEDIKMYFNINRAQVEIPAADNSKFIYDGKTQVYSIKESTAYAISNNKQINAGRYEVAVSLKDAKNYEWADGSIDDLKYNFVIGKSQVEVPAADDSKFVYNGKIQTYNIASSLLYTVEGNKQQMPGKYEVLVSLVDTKNYEWSNGTTEVLSYNFVIRAEETELTPVEIPTVTTKNFIYDGTPKSLEIASNKNYTISGNKGVDAGRYTVTLSLVDPKTTVWSDGSKEDVKMTMSIAKAQVVIPSADNRKFIYDNTDKIYNLKVNDNLVSVDNNIQVNAGRYEVTASLNDPRNYEWEDGSVDDLTYNFVIGKSQVEIPAADESKFVYNGKIQTYNIASSLLYTVDGNKKQMPGKYEVLVSLVDSKNYEWSNGTTEPLTYIFVIRAEEFEKTLVDIPTVSTKNFIYDGDVKSLEIASDKNYTISGNEGVDAGRYTVTLSLVDPAKTIWSDGSIEDVKIAFTIAKAQVEKPAANNSKFIYDGLYKVYTLKDSSVYAISNNKQINAGRYDVTVALNDAKNYEWKDGSVDDLKYNFTISKAQVEIPAADQSKFVYNGKEQTYKIPASDQYTVEGNKQTLSGRYEVLVSLTDTKNYEWENGTIDDLVYNFTIRAEELNKTVITIPTVSTKNFIYDGTAKSLKIASDKNYTITGNKGVAAGRYTVTISLVDPAKTVWSDGSSEDVNIVFTIAKAKVEIPAADGSKFVYTGKEQIYSLRDSSIYTISNNKQVNAGRYEVSVALNDVKNYEWENGTIDDLNYNFVIGKSQVEIPAADESKFVYNGKVQTYKIAESTLYTVDGNKQTMPGKYEVLVSLVDTKNYEWSNGTAETLTYNFVIRAEETELTPVVIPTVTTKNFIYNGEVRSLEIASSKDYTISGNKAINAGRYTVTLSLVDPTKTVWSDGTTDDVKVVFTIAKAQIEIPAADNSKFTYNGKEQIYSLRDSSVYSISNNNQINAGRYDVTVALNDAKNYEWENGTIDDLVYNFTISKAQVEIPAADDSKFVYNEKEQTYKIVADDRYTVDGNKQTKPGRYEVLVSLKDTKNYEWSNGTVDDLIYNFTIRAEELNKDIVTIPSVLAKNFIYDGTAKSLKIASDKNYTISGNKGIDAGRYTVTLSLTDPTKTIWSDGTTDDVKIVMTIAKAQVAIPAVDNTKFIYNGEEQTYKIVASTLYTIEGNKQTKPGRYDVIVSLKDVKNYEWENGTIDELIYNFTIRTEVINKEVITIPTVLAKNFTYDGDVKKLDIASSKYYSVTGNEGIDAGRYTVVLSLVDPTKTVWNDGTSDDVKITFSINKAQVSAPAADNTKFIYTGKELTYKLATSTLYTIEGNKQTMPGKYEVLVSLKDVKNYEWTNGTTEPLSYNFVIRAVETELTPVAIPSVATKNFIYDGEVKSLKIASSKYYTISGNKGIDAGRYTVTLALTDPTKAIWSDGSVDDIKMSFTIAKAQVEKPATNDSVFVYNAKCQTYDVVIEGDTLYTLSNNVKMNAGKYAVKIALNDAKNYEWADGSIDDLSYNFTINKAQVSAPAADNTKFIYTGKELTYKLATSTLYTIEGNKQTMPGKYEVLVSLKDVKNYEWTNGTTEPLSYNFVIRAVETELTPVTIPSVATKNFIYDGEVKSLKIADSKYYTVKGNKGVDAGRYTVTLSLTDPTKAIWSDGSVDDIKMSFTIAKAQVEKPATNDSVFVYNAKYQTYDVVIEGDTLYTLSNNVKMNAGKYAVKIALKDAKNYEWADGSIDDLSYNFTINKAQVSAPAADNTKFIYTGKELTYKLATSTLYTIEGNKQTMPGKYEVLVSLKDVKNYEWTNGTTEPLSYNFVIRAQETELTPVAIPSVATKNFIYDGEVKSLKIAESKYYTISGNKGIDAGRYTVTLALTDPTKAIWSDGSVDDIKMSFTIAKAQVEKPATNDSVFVYNAKYQTYDVVIEGDTLYTLSNNVKMNAGKYAVKIALKDAKNYEWSDGSVDDLSYNFTINKAQVSAPAADNTKFIYTGKELTYKLATSTLYTIEGNKQTMPGKYEVLVSLKDVKNYEWTNGTTEPLSYNFVIRAVETELTPVAIPSVATKNFIYDGEVKSLKIAESKYYTISGNKGIDAGRYTVTLSLTDPTKAIWSDGSVDDIKMSFTIAKAQVEKPATNDSVFVYNAKYQTYDVVIEGDTLYTLSNNVKMNAGKYAVKISLNDAKNYEWADGSIDDLSYNFTINKAQVSAPAADNTKFIYTGKELTYKLATSTLYTIEGNKQTMPGKYEVLVSLKDVKNYEWTNGTTEPLSYNFVIRAVETELTPVAIPSVATKNFIYDGTVKSLKIASSKNYTISGNKGIDAGRYTVTLALTDPTKAIWSDGSVDDIKMSFTIAKAQVEKPATNDSVYVYNAKYQTYDVVIEGDTLYTLSNNVKMNAGKYAVKISLNDAKNYEWADGSVDDLSYNFTINKAQVAIPTADNRKFVYNASSQTYKIAANNAYTVSGNTRTNAGSTLVSVTLKDTKNYMWVDGTVDVQKYNFVIEKAQVSIPKADNTVFVYDGVEKKYRIEESAYYKVSGNKQTMPGKYEVLVSLKDVKNYEWNDGTSTDLTYNFVIRANETIKKSIEIPSVLTRTFVYDGKVKSLAINKTAYFSVYGNEGTNAGRYQVRLSLNDPEMTVWSDGSTEDILMSFQIVRAQIEIPSKSDSTFVYNGKNQVYPVALSRYYTVSGNVRQNVGRYEVKVSLNDDRNYEWSDGSIDDIPMNFIINKAQVAIPAADQTKFVYSGKAQTYKLPIDSLYIISGNIQKNVGRYNVSVSLLDAKNYEWNDGTVDDLNYNFAISKAQVAIPAADETRFVYNGKAQTYNLKADSRYSIDGATKTMPGKYEVLVSLNDTKNTEWNNGTIDNLIYTFTIRAEEINKKAVEIPNVLTKNFIYDGKAKSLKIASSNDYKIYGNSGVEVGRYSVRLSLTDTKTSVWSDGSIDDIVMTFQISKAQVKIPTADTSKYFFTADYQTYKIAKSDLYTVAGDTQINVGNHDVVVSLNDTKNYEWHDGTIGDIVYSFLISKQEIDITTVKIPVVKTTKFTYDSKAHTLDVNSNDYYTVVGGTKTMAGKYVATISLRDKSTMVWEDGSTDDKTIPYVITKAIVKTPAADTTVFEYNGKEQVYGIPTNPLYKISGNVQTLVGRHIVKVSLVDYANYMWSDGTSDDLQYEFVIKLKETNILPVAIPVVSKSNFIYNGKSQTLDIKKSDYYTISGNKQTLAGSYTATVALKDRNNTSWADGTTADLVIPFTIAKAQVKIPATDSTRFVYNGDTMTCPVVANSNYVVSGDKNVVAGNYQAKVALKDKANTVWENGSSDNILIPYTIEKIRLEKPVVDSTVFVYSGDTMAIDVPANEWYNVSENIGVKAGKYNANVALIDKSNTVWVDGTTDDVVIPFSIAKAQIEIPAVDTTLFIYNGGDTLVYSIAESEYYTIKGNAQSMIGRYSVVVSLNDIENYSWSDGSTLDLIYPFIVNEREIVMTQIPYPVADTTALVYNGEMQTFNILADSNCVISGNVRMNAGRYLATVALADRNTMAWEDGSTDDIIIPFTIAKSQVEIPEADTTVFEFNGEEQTYFILEDSLYTIEGNVQTNVGRYDVFVSLVDMKNYEWSDGTTDDLIYRFAIIHPIVKDTVNPADINVPGSTIEAGDTVAIYEKPGDYIFDIKYDSVAHEQGFEDVKAEAGDSGIVIIVPEDAKPGDYEATVTITDIDGTVIDTTLHFSVSYPSALIVRLMNDVLSVNNIDNEFVSYQWYKNGKKIEGATDQFYCDLDGVRGVYKVQIVNLEGDTLFIAEREFIAIIPPFNVTLSKNPVQTGEQFTVTIEGVTDTNMLAASSLVVYDMKGTAVINKTGVEKINTMSIGNVGEFIVVVRIAGGQTVSKHLLVK